jgi:two-component system, NarL family, sensor histidine kinase LiaS
MLGNLVNRIRFPHFLDIATYVSLAAMSLLGMSGLTSLRSQLLALGLVLLFGFLYRFVFQSGRYEQNPSLYFGTQALILGLLFLLGSNNSDAFNFLFLILCIQIAVVSTARVAALWIALCFGIVSLITLGTRGMDGLYAVVFYSITFIVCGFFGYTIQQVERERDRNQQLVEELRTTQRKLQELAVVEERNRLARDLHDSVKQQVFAISMQLSAARTGLDEADQAYPSVVQAEKLAQQAGAELTTLIHQLRPPPLEKKSLAEAIQGYVNDWLHQTHIETEMNIGEVSMSPDSEQALFRVLQEALANVARHSQANKVRITLKAENDHVALTVEDNGVGYDPERITKGVGLASMQERLAAVRGTLDVSSLQSQGTSITAIVRRS